MKDALRMCGWGIALLAMASVVWSAPPAAKGASPEDLKAAAQQIIEQREAALMQWQEQYQSAPLSDRVRLEAEGANLMQEYERQYLQILVEYHQQTGNTVEMTRAQEMLDALDHPAPVPSKTSPAASEPGSVRKEGVVSDER